MPGHTTRDLGPDVSAQPARLRVLADLQPFGYRDAHADRLRNPSSGSSLSGPGRSLRTARTAALA